MGLVLMNAVWPLDLKPISKFVLLALADRADDAEGKCWPGVKWIMGRTSTSRRTVQRALEDLKDAGHISWEDVIGKGRNYTVHPCQSDTPPCQSDAGRGANATPPGANVTRGGCQPDTQSLLEPSIIPPVDSSMIPPPRFENRVAGASESASPFMQDFESLFDNGSKSGRKAADAGRSRGFTIAAQAGRPRKGTPDSAKLSRIDAALGSHQWRVDEWNQQERVETELYIMEAEEKHGDTPTGDLARRILRGIADNSNTHLAATAA